MTQQSVLNVLKRKRKWMTTKQIAKAIGVNTGCASLAAKKLFKQGLLLRKPLRPSKGLFGGMGANPYLWRIK
jgi:predicted transcriptional regulator